MAENKPTYSLDAGAPRVSLFSESTTPSFWKETAANWRLGVGPQLFNYYMDEWNNTPDENFNPWKHIDGYEEHAGALVRAQNYEQFNAIKATIDRNRRDRDISAQGEWGLISGLAAGIGDPINLIPIPGATGVGFVRGAVKAGATNLAVTAVTDPLRIAVDPTAEWSELQYSLTVSGLLGAGLGGVAGSLKLRGVRAAEHKAALQRLATELNDLEGMNTARDFNANGENFARSFGHTGAYDETGAYDPVRVDDVAVPVRERIGPDGQTYYYDDAAGWINAADRGQPNPRPATNDILEELGTPEMTTERRIMVDDTTLKYEYEQGKWAEDAPNGRKGIAREAIRNANEYVTFRQLEAVWKRLLPRMENETVADYANRVQARALQELEGSRASAAVARAKGLEAILDLGNRSPIAKAIRLFKNDNVLGDLPLALGGDYGWSIRANEAGIATTSSVLVRSLQHTAAFVELKQALDRAWTQYVTNSKTAQGVEFMGQNITGTAYAYRNAIRSATGTRVLTFDDFRRMAGRAVFDQGDFEVNGFKVTPEAREVAKAFTRIIQKYDAEARELGIFADQPSLDRTIARAEGRIVRVKDRMAKFLWSTSKPIPGTNNPRPDPKAGMVRLYRGMKSRPDGTASAVFTTDLAKASKDGEVYFVDLKASEARAFSRGADEYDLSPEIVKGSSRFYRPEFEVTERTQPKNLTPAIMIDGQMFTGSTHEEAVAAAMRELGPDIKLTPDAYGYVSRADEQRIVEKPDLPPLVAKTEDEAARILEDLFKITRWTPEEQSAVSQYTSAKTPDELDKFFADRNNVDLMQSAGAKTLAPQDIVVYRGTNRKEDINLRSDKVFTPTTLRSDWAETMGEFSWAYPSIDTIIIRKGTPIIPILKDTRREYEIILPKGIKVRAADDAEFSFKGDAEDSTYRTFETVSTKAGKSETISRPATRVVMNGVDQIFDGTSHMDALMRAEEELRIPMEKIIDTATIEDGFVTSTGRFVDRTEAGKIAGFDGELTVEDLGAQLAEGRSPDEPKFRSQDDVIQERKEKFSRKQQEYYELLEDELFEHEQTVAQAKASIGSIHQFRDQFGNPEPYFARFWNKPMIQANRVKFERLLTAWYNRDNPVGARERAAETIDRLTTQADNADEAPMTGGLRHLNKRTLNIPNTFKITDPEFGELAVADFIETDIEAVTDVYVRKMGTRIEMAKMFGDTNLTDKKAQIREYFFDRYIEPALKKGEDIGPIRDQMNEYMNYVDLIRDDVLGNLKTRDPWAVDNRVARFLKNTASLAMMGRVLITALPEAMRAPMVNGFGTAFRSLFVRAFADFEQIKGNAEFMKLTGEISDMVRNQAFARIAENNSTDVRGGTWIERELEKVMPGFYKLVGLTPWTQMAKDWAMFSSQHKIMADALEVADAVTKGAEPAAQTVQNLSALGISLRDAVLLSKMPYERLDDGLLILPTVDKWTGGEGQRARQLFLDAMIGTARRTIITPSMADLPLAARGVLTWRGRKVMESDLLTMPFQFLSYGLAASQKLMMSALQGRDANAVGGVAAMLLMGGLSVYLKTPENAWRNKSYEDILLESYEAAGLGGFWFSDLNQQIELFSRHQIGLRPALGLDPRFGKEADAGAYIDALGRGPGMYYDVTRAFWDDSLSATNKAQMIRRAIPFNNVIWWGGLTRDLATASGRAAEELSN